MAKKALIFLALLIFLLSFVLRGRGQQEPLIIKDTNGITLTADSSSDCAYLMNEDGTIGMFLGGNYEQYSEALEYERTHPESYMGPADLAIYQELKQIHSKLDVIKQVLDAGSEILILEMVRTGRFYIDPNDTDKPIKARTLPIKERKNGKEEEGQSQEEGQ
jgi:hypothetical protein